MDNQLTAINNNLIGIAISNGTFHAALLDVLGLVNTNLDTMLNNNSLNAQRLIAAILSTACPCGTTTAPLLPLPLDVTPTTLVDDEKCRRIQFYLSLFGTWLFDIANYGSSGAAITGDVLFSLLTAAGTAAGMATTGAEAGAIFGIPGAVIGTVVGLLIGAVYFLGGTQLVNYANDFNDPTLRNQMVQAMYAATNADEGYTAFKTTLLATIGGAAGEVIYTLWWSAWSNDVYSGTPVVDDSAFDGTICTDTPGEDCHTLMTELVTANIGTGDETSVGAIVWPSAFSPITVAPGTGRVWSAATFTQLPTGATVRITKPGDPTVAVTIHQIQTDSVIVFIGFATTTPTDYENTSPGSGLLIQSGTVTGVTVEVCIL